MIIYLLCPSYFYEIWALCVSWTTRSLIYWIPKLYKNPIKARFIIVVSTCFLKWLSKSITSAFKVIFKQPESYRKQSTSFSGVKSFWKILNNRPVTNNSIHNFNNRSKAAFRSCFDFWTLYTTISHNKLMKTLFEI